MQLDHAKVLLTGATGGIGECIAGELHQRGARVMLQGRSGERLEALAGSLADPVAVRIVEGDITRADDRIEIVKQARDFGVNVLINNAGINEFGCFEDADVPSMIAVNVTATLAVTQAFLPYLHSRDDAVIVNIGSAFGMIGFPGYVTYCASKHAIKGFSEALRRECADSSVKVLYVAPRATETAMNSRNVAALNERLGTTTDSPGLVAKEVCRSIERNRARVHLGWPEKFQVNLNALLPGLVDRILAGQLPLIRRFMKDDGFPRHV